ncbi:MAG: MFS transporter [Actinomycetia bacterium]|nr:MFS transporter [Actinomycetes bacterium]
MDDRPAEGSSSGDAARSEQRLRAQRRGARGAEAFIVTPFMRLARTHVLSVAGDTLVTIALAGSLFFQVSADSARSRVALYLALTAAPFALVGPLIGPMIDRAKGGRRTMMIVATASRAVLALVMLRFLNGLLLYPASFVMLVMGKAYHVSKCAIVPTLVKRDAGFVEANSKLVLIGGVASSLAFGPGSLLQWLRAGLPLVLACLLFLGASVLASRLPSSVVAQEATDELERLELRGAGILMAASAMALLRGMVGFLTFLVVFWLRSEDAAIAWFGLIGAFGVIGSMGGAALAPTVRRMLREENILGGVLILAGVVAFLAAASPSRALAAVLALTVGISTSLGKLSFDAIVQRDAPDANQGRSFARFETRFQLVWVVSALIPVLGFASLPIQIGFLVLAFAASIGAFFYLGGLRAVASGTATPADRLKQKVVSDPRVQRFNSRLRSATIGRRERGLKSGSDPGVVADYEPDPEAE